MGESDFFSSKSKNKTITKNEKDGSTYAISREPINPKKRINRKVNGTRRAV
jgi:hypothetical protein